ncbi:putative sulfate exporter family transporter [Cryobacterium sp. TMT2-18-3]|uniref:YeiH family protein n=1 Tax=unclassified Cryobacterium TaxID=2649013 RepID=UPI00106B856B|nr:MULTISPECIES: putative sulfate exporter family transporter [unclassified Cryobacterium]TFC31618.1 putative sulfate exporter family transporter [Cryobacterium sp. TMT2-18-2]TFC33493.1 putative sulfate exporter family transporter [Cryobacterium sp. TMT2-42-4]TFC67719.1 putative sulfate exporter family transporter [Cryobacterium sp. TMT2-18-3]
MWLPGVLVAAAAALLAGIVHAVFPALPLLTLAVTFGIVAGNLPAAHRALTGVLSPGLKLAATRFMRIGIVLLGLKLSLVDILGLGWMTIMTTVLIVLITFVGTYWLGRAVRLPGRQPILIATGFSICGASAIGAMSGVVKAKDVDTATPIALVTLCGTLAIAVLPVLWHPLGLTDLQFGHWVGAGVHDVGQVVATAQIAGPAALAVAVVVKLTRVLLLAPIVAVVAVGERRRETRVATVTDAPAFRPPLVPLFVAGFLAAVLVRTFVPLPDTVLAGADTVQTYLLAAALFGLGAAVNLGSILRTGGRALLVGLTSWTLIATLAFAAVQLP